VGSLQAGTKSNIIASHAVLLVNVRSYDEATRARQLAAIERIVNGECAASGSPKPAEFEYYDRFPLTENTPEVYEHVSAAFAAHFGDRVIEIERSTGSEDFSEIPKAFGAPFLFWFWGGFDPEVYAQAELDGTVHEVIPANHNGNFAPVMAPTMGTGITAMTLALLSYLGREADQPYAMGHEIGTTAE
ncbi:MAG: peptidase dimerization domain-containing protein, partial [Jatrophihabitantaceae bacterium]